MGPESTSCICGTFWTLACCPSLWRPSQHASWHSSRRPKPSSMWTCTYQTKTSATPRCLTKSPTLLTVSSCSKNMNITHDSNVSNITFKGFEYYLFFFSLDIYFSQRSGLGLYDALFFALLCYYLFMKNIQFL